MAIGIHTVNILHSMRFLNFQTPSDRLSYQYKNNYKMYYLFI